ncbi:Phthiocerol/phenolphthiocerol synthesis polyketide synthase type I PpsE [Pelagimonas phthalicica]|uniref:Phthiocerol/phenolphthiocerol synthesis polyketide synthase type I PpsE n=1 Tax=Pelagimonas phthalicica TaxID=1037362 RepID=A0A238J932_9RHOB|nr:acyl transferase domain-containing protein [Pelagimonas phthalicica]SMX26462.1 Phthiocerol/phenolphthiocerol synthesis polyketide synthase type I PpsE [Pelagimonas phthalicica]
MMSDDQNFGENDIAIVGMAAHLPGAEDIATYWRNLRDGVSSIRRLSEEELQDAGEDPGLIRHRDYVPFAAPLNDFEMFDAEFFGFSPKEAAIMDPQHRQFLETAWEALENAGHVPENFPGQVGVFAGCGMGSYFYFNICSNPDLVESTGMFLLRHTGNDKDFLTTRLSHVLDLHGPSIGVQTACSTSLVATHYAAQALLNGECDMALAGGVTIELSQGRGYLYKENEILSPDGACHAFDHRAKGTVFGSGSGVVVLRRMADAVADGDHIWGVLKSTAVNNDGAQKAGYLAPSVDGQAKAVAEAHALADITADTVDYVECHGTGTYLGDPIEVAALTQAFGESSNKLGHCRIGSVKTNIGHLDTAAGVASMIKATLALHHKQMPPSLGYEAPNPAIDFENSPFRVNDTLTDWQAQGHPRRAGVNSLGVGGTNAHVILEEAPTRVASEESDFPFQILSISGRSKAAMEANAKRMADHLEAHADQDLADIAWTLQNGRRAFEKRRVVVAETHSEAAELLRSDNTRRVHSHTALTNPDIAFMFPGGGAQYAGMGRDLYETEPVFAEWMDRGLDHLATLSREDMRALWLPAEADRVRADEALRQPSLQLPLIMIVEYALAQLWMSWGIEPAALAGHSMGENTAACVAGVMSFEDCIGLVHLRGKLFDTVPAGGMLSVAMPAEDLRPLLGADLDLGAVNAPELSVASGPQAALDRLEAELKAKDIDAQRIQIDIAAHSRMLDPILEDFRTYLRSITLNPPQVPLTSNRTGALMTAEQATDPDYWVEHLRGTVHFADCIGTLAKEDRIFLEVGPGKALSALSRQHSDVTPNQVISSLRHPEDAIPDDKHMFEVMGRLWALGAEIDWEQIWGEARRVRVPLPTYAFQRSPYFIAPGEAKTDTASQYLMRSDDISDWGWKPVWRPRSAQVEVDIADLAEADPQTWLIFRDESGLASGAATQLRAANHQVVEVSVGDSFARLSEDHYLLSPERGREGYDMLLQDLAARGVVPTRIAHFWLVTQDESHRPGSSFFHRVQEQGFYSLMFLAQALAEEGTAKPHISIFTNSAAKLRDEALPYPAKATIAGPARVIPRELPGVTVSTCDLELPKAPQSSFWGRAKAMASHATSMQALTSRVLEELLAEPADLVAALRKDRRFEAAMKPVKLDDTPKVASNGTYLITGGFGGIGQSLAMDFAQHGAKLILLARKSLPDRAEWDSYVTRHAPTDAIARRIRAVQALEEAGATVMVRAADVCNRDQMQAVKDAAEAEFGPITGVIHGAGVIDDAPLMTKTPASVEDVFTPKIHGTEVLGQVFPDGSVDWMVLFSSSSTVTAPAGQIDYVAANEYLNAFARARSGATKVVAINWGIWNEVGMAAEAVAARSGDLPKAPLEPVELPMLDDMSFDAHGNRIFHASYSADDWFIDEHRTKAGDALLPGTGYLTLAAHALDAHHQSGSFELRDLNFLRPLRVADGGTRDVRVRLNRTEEGYGFDVLADTALNGRNGFALTAQGGLSLLPMSRPDPVDLNAVYGRCGSPTGAPGQKLSTAQEVHLAFGPRWKVLDNRALGQSEGIAELSLPDLAQGDHCLLHPALMDIATGWAMELIQGYQPTHLWVPVRYARVRVHAPLPDRIISWVRNAAENRADAETASFDVTLCDLDGNVIVEISGFTIRKLENLDVLKAPARLTPAEVEFDDAPEAGQPLSPAEERLAHNLSQGILPAEGVQAFHRALALGAPQVVVSSMDLDALTRQTAASTAEAGETQKFDRPELEGDYVAPENEIERQLAAFWEELLGVQNVGVEDSFFDLGGHSLIAVRLFAKVKKAFRIDFPISVLFEAPTIRKCAALIAEQIGMPEEGDTPDAPKAPERRFRHIVPMHDGDGGARQPFFLIAGMFGNVLNLRHLAHLLGADRPFYGLQAKGLLGGEAPHEKIEDAARDYIEEMRQVQPEGPYMLGGFSGGGITAYEIAHQLEMMGEEVSLVVMLDTPLPQRRPLSRKDRMIIQWHQAREKGPLYPLIWAKNRIAWEFEKRRQVEETETAGAFHNAEIEAAFYRSIAAYTVKPWTGRLVLFRPPLQGKWQVTGGAMVNSERTYLTNDNDWGLFVPHVEVHEVPGDHDSMVLEPNVRVLAAGMRAAIEEAEARVAGHGEVVKFPTQAAE